MIKLVNVSKIYNNSGVLTTGLHNISLELSRGEIVAITGESGSGKSTLLNVLTKMDLFDEGEYYYKGNETSYFDVNDMDNFRKNKVGFIFQNYNIIDSYSVLENVMLPFKIKGMDKATAKARAMELIEKVGLKHRWKNKGVQLSGGEKQRCVIARALASDCEILACDEPTGNLDSKTSEEIISLIKEVAKDKLVLIVTHNFEQVKDIVTRKIKVHNGEIVEDTIYKSMPADEDIPLDLDYVPLKKKIKVNIAKNNLVNTPKRTFLSVLVFLFVAIFALSLYQAIYYMRDNEFYLNNFLYKGDNKLIVYNINNDRTVNLDDIKSVTSEYGVNNFYEQSTYSVYFNDIGYSLMVCYEKNPMSLKLDGGRLPESENECVLMIPKDYYIEGEDYLNQNFSINMYSYNYELVNVTDFTVVGYTYRSDITCCMITGNDKFEEIVKICSIFNGSDSLYFNYDESTLDWDKENKSENIDNSEFVTDYLDIVIETNPDDIYQTYLNVIIDPTLEKSYLLLESYYSMYNEETFFVSDIVYSGYTFTVSDTALDIQYEDNVSNTIYIGRDFINQIEKNPYEISIYTENKSSTISIFENMGYVCADVKTFSNESSLVHFITNLWSYVMMVISSVVIVIIYFISYVILAKIYTSKKKDYTILRTLGISKRDMKDIVLYEVMAQTIFVSVLTYLVLFITSRFYIGGVFVIFSKISIFSTILYFVIMLIFGHFIARRFNSKLFKFSVNATLKGGEAKND